jgi:hypothetical protein
MNDRDKAIVTDIQRFRCLTRDDIADLHFAHTKHPITQANMVLKRLRRDGLLKCSTERRKYVYFPYESKVKPESQKISHFLAVADFYKEVRAHGEPRVFEVEPKYGKGMPEPDAFMIWRGNAWFVEVQRTVYTDKVMKAKLDRYEAYYNSGEWEREPWQPPNKKIFPWVWITGIGRYNLGARPYRAIQDDVPGLVSKLTPKKG